MNVILRFVLVAFVLATTSLAAAQPTDDDRARGHFQAGTSYFDQGRYLESAEQFDEAFALSPRPRLLANAALAYERGGNLALAIERLEAYLASGAQEAEDTREANTVRLERLRAELAASEAEPATDGTEAPEPEVASEPPLRDTTGRRRRRVGLVAGTIGLASAGTSLGLFIASRRIHEDLVNACGPAGDACPDDRADDIDRGRRLQTLSAVMLGTSIAGIAVGATLDMLGRRSTATRVNVDIADHGVRVDIAGRF